MVSKDLSSKQVFKKVPAVIVMVLMCWSFAGISADDSTGPTQSINKIEVISAETGEEVLIWSDKPFEHSAFLLSDPERLVLDIPNVALAITSPESMGNCKYLKGIDSRSIQDKGKELVRIELMLANNAPYRIETMKTGIKVVFGEVKTGAPVESADAHSMTQSLPEAAAEMPSMDNPQPASSGNETTAANVYGLAAPTQYKGKPIFLDLKDADILDIFRLIAEVSEFNVVVDPDVGGRITIRMDNVPWDQALEVILKNQGLGKEIEGNIMRIAKNEKLRNEAELKAQLEAAKRKAEKVETIILYLSYAQISNMETTLKIFLSERGSIVKDDRVNALVIRDIRPILEHIKDMVKILDVRTRQVSLSAQIIQSSKDFNRVLGIQWGGKFVADALHGNTTKYQFPNNFTVDMATYDDKYAINFPAGDDLLGLHFGNILNTLNLDVMLSAAEQEGMARTIARPRVTTANNMAATLTSGQQIPVSTTSADGTQTEWKNAATSINITPHITNDDYISMAVTLNRDSLGTFVDIPIINTNSATTNVLVKDGDTLVIGGLTDSTYTEGENRVPFFGKLPVIGYLFKNTGKVSAFKDLLFFITPQILDEGEQIVRAQEF